MPKTKKSRAGAVQGRVTRQRGRGKKPRRDRKHNPAELAAHEDSRRRHGEKQEVVARQLGVDSRRLREALHGALYGDDLDAFLAVLNARLDDRANEDRAERIRANMALATELHRRALLEDVVRVLQRVSAKKK